MFKLRWGYRTTLELPGGLVVRWSNVIFDPSTALIRAQLGFRSQVGAVCGKKQSGIMK